MRGGNVQARGYNTYKEHATRGGGPLQTLHAEAAAIRAAETAGTELRGATIVVVRIPGAGGSQMSKPCRDCARLIESKGIKKVIYTDETGDLIQEYTSGGRSFRKRRMSEKP